MTLMTSNEDAALLDAGRLALEMAQRYRYSIEHLIEPEATRRLLGERSEALEEMAERLAQIARAADLLPREPDLEMSELRTLADQFSSWIDDETCSKLLERFAEGERELLGELETADDGSAGRRRKVLADACKETDRFLNRLASR
jgi:hypothetical protein